MAAENNIANGRWYSFRPFQVSALDPNLSQDISDLVIDLQLALHPQADASPVWALRANQDYPDSVFIFAGQFVPDRVDRFTMRMLRWRINNGGAEVKPRGVEDGYLQGRFTAAQDDVMARALDFMAARSAEMNAMEAAQQHLEDLQEGMEQHLFLNMLGHDNANNANMDLAALLQQLQQQQFGLQELQELQELLQDQLAGDDDPELIAPDVLGDAFDAGEEDGDEEEEEEQEDGMGNNNGLDDDADMGGGGGGGGGGGFGAMDLIAAAPAWDFLLPPPAAAAAGAGGAVGGGGFIAAGGGEEAAPAVMEVHIPGEEPGEQEAQQGAGGRGDEPMGG
ncbi:hypothetical protein HYH02_010325 [Chlamydomonas schloesseri]|uniref:Uncharacterized protein n=1 Tax=Chlamydomonas schloesseri TaxID=2026947 RepID=A0A835W4N1_9CHLO|nr:hypothetical protein HYH02_010325 [Chlamydomonas schloesseri]|eukprot:KAG2440442.1 hypothetical protein HYH02_010325 [Chlamydomonas schloesseri]